MGGRGEGRVGLNVMGGEWEGGVKRDGGEGEVGLNVMGARGRGRVKRDGGEGEVGLNRGAAYVCMLHVGVCIVIRYRHYTRAGYRRS